MRLTFVANSTSFPSGGILAIFELANGMRRRGHDVTLVHLPNFTMHDWVGKVEQIRWCRFEEGIEHRFDVQGLGPPDLSALPDGDVIFWFRPGMPPRAGLPVMLVQGILAKDARERLLSPVPKVCFARWLVDFALQLGVPQQQLGYVPYGLRHEKYRLIRTIADRPRQIAMLYNGHPLKGAPDGLRALEEVSRRVPDARIVVFGAKPPAQELPASFDYRLDVDQRVIVEEIYNGSAVFLQSSIREGFGLAAVEAMACGCALVSTANGGSNDYARDGDTALVSAPRDIAALIANVERILTDDALRIRLARAGHEFVKIFNWDTTAARLEQCIDAFGPDEGCTRPARDTRGSGAY
jgi:glycosyltransferase involved in cell wall biosynthesis